MGAAIQALPDMNAEQQYMTELNRYCREKLQAIDNVQIHSSEQCLPYILNFSVEGIRSETMLHYLEGKGIYVSNGSACAKGKKSHVLQALGLRDRLIESALRVSFSRYTTKEEIEELADAIAKNTLARSR